MQRGRCRASSTTNRCKVFQSHPFNNHTGVRKGAVEVVSEPNNVHGPTTLCMLLRFGPSSPPCKTSARRCHVTPHSHLSCSRQIRQIGATSPLSTPQSASCTTPLVCTQPVGRTHMQDSLHTTQARQPWQTVLTSCDASALLPPLQTMWRTGMTTAAFASPSYAREPASSRWPLSGNQLLVGSAVT